jgi:hypothetical protein
MEEMAVLEQCPMTRSVTLRVKMSGFCEEISQKAAQHDK